MDGDFASNVRQILEEAEKEFGLRRGLSKDFGKTFNEMAEKFRTTSARVDEDLRRGARTTKHRVRL